MWLVALYKFPNISFRVNTRTWKDITAAAAAAKFADGRTDTLRKQLTSNRLWPMLNYNKIHIL
jgi:hypothetical protein